jgi:hypothetical protein
MTASFRVNPQRRPGFLLEYLLGSYGDIDDPGLRLLWWRRRLLLVFGEPGCHDAGDAVGVGLKAVDRSKLQTDYGLLSRTC